MKYSVQSLDAHKSKFTKDIGVEGNNGARNLKVQIFHIESVKTLSATYLGYHA